MTALEGYLGRHGLDPVQADIWAKFLGAVLAAMDAAVAMTRHPAYWTAHVAKEGALLKPRRKRAERTRRLPSEEGLTCALAENLLNIRIHASPDSPLRAADVQFESEARMPSKSKTGKHLCRIDVMARSLSGPEAPFIVFEAKLVVDDEDIAGAYLGAEGLGCFRRAKDPYPARYVAAMVAYTVDRSFEEWSTVIEAEMADPIHRVVDVHWPHHSGTCTELLWTRVDREPAETPDVDRSDVDVAHLVLRFEPVPFTPPPSIRPTRAREAKPRKASVTKAGGKGGGPNAAARTDIPAEGESSTAMADGTA